MNINEGKTTLVHLKELEESSPTHPLSNVVAKKLIEKNLKIGDGAKSVERDRSRCHRKGNHVQIANLPRRKILDTCRLRKTRLDSRKRRRKGDSLVSTFDGAQIAPGSRGGRGTRHADSSQPGLSPASAKVPPTRAWGLLENSLRHFRPTISKRKFCSLPVGSGGHEAAKIEPIDPSGLVVWGVRIVVRGFVGEIRAPEVGRRRRTQGRDQQGGTRSGDPGRPRQPVRPVSDPPELRFGTCAQLLPRACRGGVAGSGDSGEFPDPAKRFWTPPRRPPGSCAQRLWLAR